MVRGISIDGGRVSLTIVLTTPACPLRETIQQDVERALSRVPGVTGVDLKWDAEVRAVKGLDGKREVPGVKNLIAIASNKGGVGKSTVAVNLSVALASLGARVGLIDADITGPNIPTMLGIEQGYLVEAQQGLHTIERYGVQAVSLGFVLPKGQAVVWRGPMIGTAVRQLIHDIPWGELDYLVIDLPPGTSDASMSMAQEAPIAGVVIVSTPQDVALEDATKAVMMFDKLNVPVFGIVENMSYFICPHCGERTEIFGHGGAERAADEIGVEFLGEVPIDPSIRVGSDSGVPVVVSHPDSPQARAFIALAEKVAARCSVLSYAGA
jgi:ATP-binding protein involved in chromosome partitioning